MSPSEDIQLANAQIQDMVGRDFSEFRMGFGLRLDFGDDWLVTIETPFSMSGDVELFGGEPVSGEAAAALLPLRLRRVSSAQVQPDGTLTIGMEDGVLSVPAHPLYESWQVAGPRGVLVVCPPSASYIAVWADDGQSGSHGFRYGSADSEA
ncbi:MAG: DUF6188 family protein [Pseudolysinimonas sp.]